MLTMNRTVFTLRNELAIHADLGLAIHKGKGEIVTGWNPDFQGLVVKAHLPLGNETGQTFFKIIRAIVVNEGAQNRFALFIHIHPALFILYQALPLCDGDEYRQ